MALGQKIGTTPIWWELQNIPDEMVEELRRRNNSNNIGISYEKNINFDYQNKYTKYKGPLTPWVRVFSNSTGKSLNILVDGSGYLKRENDPIIESTGGYDGFILKGADGFYDAFGYDVATGLTDKNAIIGYQANGQPHFLNGNKNQYKYSAIGNFAKFPQNNVTPRILPPPGVVSTIIRQSKEFLSFATVKFRCYGLAQLEYLTPFFLNPGINVFVEFGYNLFNQKSLVNLSDRTECWNLVSIPQTAYDKSLLSNGNYGCVSGIITKYQYNTSDGFVYNCEFEITSRQGLYAGLKTDNVVSVQSESNREENTYLTLKNFIKDYLPNINEVIRTKQNFYNYIVSLNRNLRKSPNIFYSGKIEDRVFTGRREDVYKKSKSIQETTKLTTTFEGRPISIGNVQNNIPMQPIQYENIEDIIDEVSVQYSDVTAIITRSKHQVSNIDKYDFDSEDNNDEVWLQLDFVFDLFNLLMSTHTSNRFKITNTDIIVNAHPNLMSLNTDLLIPNPVSPKINKGRPRQTDENISGYLKDDAALSGKNRFLNCKADIKISEKDITKSIRKTDEITATDGLNKASNSVRSKFKTAFYERDNIDTLINYLFYNSNNNHQEGSASFPFKSEITVSGKRYKPYYYGYLKHLYISKNKLISLVNSEENKGNYRQLLINLLNFINESVDNFWKFEIVENPEGKGLSIIDKNAIDTLEEIYMFNLSSTRNVIRSINFDVSLTNEQAINVLFGGSTDQNLLNVLKKQTKNITSAQEQKTLYSKIGNIPPLKFADRMDGFELEQFISQNSGSYTNTNVPGTPRDLYDNNKDISYLQTPSAKQDILMMTVKYVDNLDSQTNTDAVENKNTKYLNWNESMRGMLRSILTDGDIHNNVKYSGVADNFQITIVFEGIFGFRNLQCFAIDNLPNPYVPGNVIFQVLECEHQIESGVWITTITALVRSVGGKKYKYIPV